MPELSERKKELQKVLEEKGVTYNIYSKENSFSQSWKLDPIPFIIPEGIWDKLEKGLTQRALLLDLLMKDLYSDQKCIKDGVLPVELIFSDPAFLRACNGIVSKRNTSYSYMPLIYPEALMEVYGSSVTELRLLPDGGILRKTGKL